LDDCLRREEDESERRVQGHDREVEAVASALKKVADDVVGATTRCRDIARKIGACSGEGRREKTMPSNAVERIEISTWSIV